LSRREEKRPDVIFLREVKETKRFAKRSSPRRGENLKDGQKYLPPKRGKKRTNSQSISPRCRKKRRERIHFMSLVGRKEGKKGENSSYEVSGEKEKPSCVRASGDQRPKPQRERVQPLSSRCQQKKKVRCLLGEKGGQESRKIPRHGEVKSRL